jgi:hypothetical protein
MFFEEQQEVTDISKNKLEVTMLEFKNLLEEYPENKDKIFKIFEVSSKNKSSYFQLLKNLEILVGSKVAQLVITSCRYNNGKFLNLLEKEISVEGNDVSEAISFLRYVTAVYGDYVEKSYSSSLGDPDDWYSSEIKLTCEISNNKWFLSADILKNSGESVHLKLEPKSAFSLLERMLIELSNLPATEIDKEVLNTFKNNTTRFNNNFFK